MHKFPVEIKEVQYYINNTCNLSCSNCVTFNNLNFKGYFKFSNSQNKNELWPNYINPGRITILGGEPFLNPFLKEWIIGLYNIWPTHNNRTVCTNGTLFDKKTYKNLAKLAIELGYKLEVSVHYEGHLSKIIASLENLLSELNIQFYCKHENTKSTLDNQIIYYNKFDNSKIIFLYKSYYFFKNSIVEHRPNQLVFYQNNYIKSHEVCPAKECHYIIEGNLYKCPVVAVGPLLKKQFTALDNNLFDSYKYCDPLTDLNTIHDFLLALKNPILQCSLCPSTSILEKIL